MEQNQEMKLLLKQNSKALEFCLRGTLTLLRKKTHEYSTITMTSFAHTCLNAERKEKERDRQIYTPYTPYSLQGQSNKKYVSTNEYTKNSIESK